MDKSQIIKKREAEELEFWVNGVMPQSETGKRKWLAWLNSEAACIKGMIHRARQTPLTGNEKVLQIGSGPCDVIDVWRDGERHAIDPLADEYKMKFHEFQDSSVEYIRGYGENLPYEDESFDVIIIRNAIDHTDNPYKVAHEAFRVLKANGAMYIWIYQYSLRGSLVYRFINFLTGMFAREPWVFTFDRIIDLLESANFIPVLPATEARPYVPDMPKDIRITSRIKYILKEIIKKAINFKHDKGFSCIALPRKEGCKEWRMPR